MNKPSAPTGAFLDHLLERARSCDSRADQCELLDDLRRRVIGDGDEAVALFCEVAHTGSEAARARLAEMLGAEGAGPAAAVLYNFGVDIGHGMEVAR